MSPATPRAPRAKQAPGGTTAPRGEHTRALIVDTALRLFRDHGYDKTTMRLIATEAGVSLGNAYYYFPSKEHLVQAFYDENQVLHREAARSALTEADFADRLRGVLHAWVDAMEPYHVFAGKFFKNAAEPDSPLSPLSAESTPAREASIGLYREVIDGSTPKPRMAPELRDELPYLLWLYQMGVVLYWVHDKSPRQQHTRTLVDRTVPMIDRLVGLSRLRLLRPLVRDTLDLVATIGPGRLAGEGD